MTSLRIRLALLLGVTATAVSAAAQRAPAAPAAAATTTYTVDAIGFGVLPDFPVRGLVAGADSARRMDIALMVWALRAPGAKTVLVDAGFSRRKFIDRWKPRDYELPSDAVRRAGIRPEDVSDVIVSHVHWDHADGIDLFPNARVWIQRAEFEYYVGPRGESLNPAIDAEVAAMLRRLSDAGRVRLVDGDDQEILPGIRVYTGGKHTWASQFVGVRTAAGTAIIASDNAYLYENLARRRPIAQTLDSASNLGAQRRMLQLAGGERLVVPGHDPAVFTRFPAPGRGVARVQ